MNNWSSKIICKTDKISSKNGKAPLALQVFLPGRIKKHVHLGIHVDPKKWDKANQCLKATTKEEEDINLMINNFKANENNILVEFRLRNTAITWERFLKRFKMNESMTDFLLYFENKIDEKEFKTEIVSSTAVTHRVILKRCKLFKSTWPFAGIDDDFIIEFKKFLFKHLDVNTQVTGKRLVNNGHNTVNITLKIVKTYLLAAQKDKIYFQFPNIDVSFVKTSRAFLTAPELKILIEMYREEKIVTETTLHQSLEMFLFACGTGMRISDIKRLNTKDIIDGFIHIKPQKTQKYELNLRIPINAFVAKILDCKTGTIFPKYAEPTINEALKEIAARAGINKNLTMNVGRHTFATLFLQKGGNLKALQDILGHKNIVTTQNYLHIDHNYLKDEIKNMDSIFGKD
jgi:integrase